MSKLVESLQADLRKVFGATFGEVSAPVENLSEAVASALTERRRGGDFAPQVKNKKIAHDFAREHERKTNARIKRNMAAFFKHADAEAEKSAKRPRPEKMKSDPKPDQKSGGARKVTSKSSVGGGSGRHNPFKHSPNLGTGPGTPPGFRPVQGKRHHDERKCWNCKCGNVYDKGCECIGTGKTKDCPKGHSKHVQIHKDYRHAYNDMYHAWRRGEGKHANRKGKWQGPRK